MDEARHPVRAEPRLPTRPLLCTCGLRSFLVANTVPHASLSTCVSTRRVIPSYPRVLAGTPHRSSPFGLC